MQSHWYDNFVLRNVILKFLFFISYTPPPLVSPLVYIRAKTVAGFIIYNMPSCNFSEHPQQQFYDYTCYVFSPLHSLHKITNQTECMVNKRSAW